MSELLSVSVVYIYWTMVEVGKSNEFVQHGEPSSVIHIFGSTPAGQRVCAHIHGVYSYFYFRPADVYDTSFDSECFGTDANLGRLLDSLEKLLHARRVDRAYHDKLNKNTGSAKMPPYRAPEQRASIKALSVVRARSIYGYHPHDQAFVKVHLVNPYDKRALVEILEAGDGGSGLRPMQTWESHIPFVLQFTTDYNVTPMGWLKLDYCKFRHPLPADIVLPDAGAGLPGAGGGSGSGGDGGGGDGGSGSTGGADISSDRSGGSSGGSSSSSNSHSGHRVFTQSTTPVAYLWQNDHSKSSKPVDMGWRSTQDMLAAPTTQERADIFGEQAAAQPVPAPMTSKDSTCALELDTLAHCIMHGPMHVPHHPPQPAPAADVNAPPSQQSQRSQDSYGGRPHTFFSPGAPIVMASGCGAANTASSGSVSVPTVISGSHRPRSIWGAAPPGAKLFGQELWLAEQKRRAVHNLGPEVLLTPPSTDTRYRPLAKNEEEFRVRLDQLLAMGKSLDESGGDMDIANTGFDQSLVMGARFEGSGDGMGMDMDIANTGFPLSGPEEYSRGLEQLPDDDGGSLGHESESDSDLEEDDKEERNEKEFHRRQSQHQFLVNQVLDPERENIKARDSQVRRTQGGLSQVRRTQGGGAHYFESPGAMATQYGLGSLNDIDSALRRVRMQGKHETEQEEAIKTQAEWAAYGDGDEEALPEGGDIELKPYGDDELRPDGANAEHERGQDNELALGGLQEGIENCPTEKCPTGASEARRRGRNRGRPPLQQPGSWGQRPKSILEVFPNKRPRNTNKKSVVAKKVTIAESPTHDLGIGEAENQGNQDAGADSVPRARQAALVVAEGRDGRPVTAATYLPPLHFSKQADHRESSDLFVKRRLSTIGVGIPAGFNPDCLVTVPENVAPSRFGLLLHPSFPPPPPLSLLSLQQPQGVGKIGSGGQEAKSYAPGPAQMEAELAPPTQGQGTCEQSRLVTMSLEIFVLTRPMQCAPSPSNGIYTTMKPKDGGGGGSSNSSSRGDRNNAAPSSHFSANPTSDRIAIIAYRIDDTTSGGGHETRRESGGVFCLQSIGRRPSDAKRHSQDRGVVLTKNVKLKLPDHTDLKVSVFSDEASMLLAFVELVRLEIDPDILVGFDVSLIYVADCLIFW